MDLNTIFAGFDLGLAEFIVAVLGLGVALWGIWFLIKDRKGLGYRVDYSASLVSVRDVARSDIKIFYKDATEPLKNPRIVKVSFQSTGRKEIEKNAFEEDEEGEPTPLILAFEDDAKIISVEVEDESPNQLVVNAEAEDGNKVVIQPLLLNAGDRFSLKVLGENVSDFSVEGRISGVNEIKDLDNTWRARFFRGGIEYPLALIALLVCFIFYISESVFSDLFLVIFTGTLLFLLSTMTYTLIKK